MSKEERLKEAKRLLIEESARKIAEAARNSIKYHYERTGGQTVPAFVITAEQRKDLLVGPLQDPYAFQPGYRGPDLLYGVPCFITYDKNWPCPTNLVDLRSIE